MPMKLRAILSRRRFRPSLWPTLGLLLLVAVTVALGNWQRQRAHDKQSLRDQYEAASHAPPLELDADQTVAADPGRFRFRAVRARGIYDAAHQVLIDNRVHAGRAGFDVVAPLKLGGGPATCWSTAAGWRKEQAAPFCRRCRRPPDPSSSKGGSICRRRAISSSAPIRMPGRYARTSTSPESPRAADCRCCRSSSSRRRTPATGWCATGPAPDFGIEQHKSYMVQWYSLAATGRRALACAQLADGRG